MDISDEVKKFKDKRILIIGEALLDKYISGYADKISPDAPVPNIKIEDSTDYLGGVGLVIQFIKSLGGIPEICSVVGEDYEGERFVKKIKELGIKTSEILMDSSISTPQITRVKAMNQHVLRLETDYSNEIPQKTIDNLYKHIGDKSKDVGAILILDYGIGGLFKDNFIQKLLILLKDNHSKVPILARPNSHNYYLYEGIDLIKINLQKALNILSISCCNETSIGIAGKKILNASKCKNVLLNYVESESYLFSKDNEKIEKISPILKEPVRSFVAVGSTVMAVLGLSFASKIPVKESAQISQHAAALSATLPPVEFFNQEQLSNYISARLNNK